MQSSLQNTMEGPQVAAKSSAAPAAGKQLRFQLGTAIMCHGLSEGELEQRYKTASGQTSLAEVQDAEGGRALRVATQT